jgi:hypothetical protein
MPSKKWVFRKSVSNLLLLSILVVSTVIVIVTAYYLVQDMELLDNTNQALRRHWWERLLERRAEILSRIRAEVLVLGGTVATVVCSVIYKWWKTK